MAGTRRCRHRRQGTCGLLRPRHCPAVGPTGHVLAIDADTQAADHVRHSAGLFRYPWVRSLHPAIGDSVGETNYYLAAEDEADEAEQSLAYFP